jgi:hypothetical protein
MKNKLIALFFGAMGLVSAYGQNKQVLYGFDELPQTLLLNPGANVSYKYHVGIPLLSGISLQTGMTGITLSDLFLKDGVDFNVKYRNALNNITTNDYIQMNVQTEILSGGYRLDDRHYLTAGFYTELDVFANIPKDILTLINEGNASNLNKSFLLSQANVKAEALSVLHFGISRKINRKLTAGARLKIYSGIMNAMSTNNSGSFSTRRGQNNIYTHYLNNVDIRAYSSGLYNENDEGVGASAVLGRLFFGGNLGLGLDLGITYKLDAQTEFSASILDLGFVNYSKDVRNGQIKGSYSFSGVEFQYDSSSTDYWENLNNDFKAKVPSEENRESYTVARPVKFNGSVKHSWGRTRREETCYDMSYEDYFDNAIGGQIFVVTRPTGPKFALTGFYEKRLLKGLAGKVTYTVDDFSYSNVGLGLSAKIGKVNMYTAIDNIFQLPNLASANNVAFQLGFNLLFN